MRGRTQLRERYEAEVRALADLRGDLTAAGVQSEQVARVAI